MVRCVGREDTHLPGVDANGAAHDPHGRRELAQQHHPRVVRPRRPLHLHVLEGEAVEAVSHGRVEEAVRQAQVRQPALQREAVLVFQLFQREKYL